MLCSERPEAECPLSSMVGSHVPVLSDSRFFGLICDSELHLDGSTDFISMMEVVRTGARIYLKFPVGNSFPPAVVFFGGLGSISLEMESYSLALQLQAAQEVIGEEMPRRALIVKMLLFSEVASALLMVQLGQFTHAGLIAIPFFLTSLAAIHREHWSQSMHIIPDPRSVLLAVLSPKNYSMFGLRRRQQGVAAFLSIMIFLRILCLVPLAVTLPAKCGTPGCWYHFCWYYTDSIPPRWYFWTKLFNNRPDNCEWPPARWDFIEHDTEFSWSEPTRFGTATSVTREDFLFNVSLFEKWCERNGENRTRLRAWPVTGYSGLCAEDFKLVPAIARHSCIAGTWDPLLYQYCLKESWLPNMCNAEFMLCSYATGNLEGQALLVLTYILIPGAALLLMLLIHVLVLVCGNFSTIHAEEDAQLRRTVQRRAASLQERLRTDQLEGSLWWSRRTLEAKLCFFLADILLDMVCCVNFFRAEAYAFGGCQLVILLFSGILQLKVGFRSTCKAIRNSLRKGLPNNVVHLLLLQEKTFEAPLSLFFQYYAAFYVNEDLAAFASLWVSMFFSIIGIANGIYIYNHLTLFDLELMEEEELSEMPPSAIGVSSLTGIQAPLPPPPGLTPHQEMRPKQTLPPPPGLGFTPASRVKQGRKPGQYVSDTE
eukprot:symbB.v1.2.031813.t1/scaffold3735.1/size51219/3